MGHSYYTLGFEDMNNGRSLRVILNISGLSEAQAQDGKRDLLDWAAGYGGRVFYQLASKVDSPEAYRAHFEQGMDSLTRENLIYILTTPFEEDRMFSIEPDPGLKRFLVVPEGFYAQEPQSTSLFWGVGAEGVRFASGRGQFIKGDIELVSAVTGKS